MTDRSHGNIKLLLSADNTNTNVNNIYEGDKIGRITLLNRDAFDMFLNKSTLIVGGTGSGKSTVIYDIFDMLHDHVSVPLIFIPELSVPNNDYSSIISSDKFFIHKPPTIERFREIVTAQTKNAKAYRYAHDIDNLMAFNRKYNIVSLQELNDKMRSAEINASSKDDVGYRQYISDRYDRSAEAMIIKGISLKRKELINNPNLSENDKIIVLFAGSNPNITIVIDDYSAELKSLFDSISGRSVDNTQECPINTIITKGRHLFITILFIIHNPSDIKPQHRKLFSNIIVPNTSNFTSNYSSINGKQPNAALLSAVNSIFSETIKFATDITGKSVKLPAGTDVDRFVDRNHGTYVKKELSVNKIILNIDNGIYAYKPTLREHRKIGDSSINKIISDR